MNEYKITYSTKEGNAQRTIIERSERAAWMALKADVKGAEISDIELIDTDVNATKTQERETLEKIKAMVEELGPQSYLKTAFDGIFEVSAPVIKCKKVAGKKCNNMAERRKKR